MSLAYRSYPNNFVYSGNVNGSSVSLRSSYGYYWTASGNASDSAYAMYFGSSIVYPGTNNVNKYFGWVVRCVAGV